MNGETDLKTLLAAMQPVLHELPHVFCSSSRDISRLPLEPLGTFREQEGISIIVTQQQASDNGLPFDMTWACITLQVHSSLSAVGFLAAITSGLHKQASALTQFQLVITIICSFRGKADGK